MLEKLRAKPDHVKKWIALAVAAIISGIIFLVWLSSFDARQNGDYTRDKTVSPLDGVASMFQGIVSDVKTSFSDMPSYLHNMGAGATTDRFGHNDRDIDV
jgi:hypothetical protein